MKTLINKIREHQNLLIYQHAPAKDAPTVKTESQEDILKFKELYDQHIVDSMDTSRNVESDGFHPSVLGTAFGKCSRYGVYLLRGEEKENTFEARTLRIFANGNSVHERIQETITNMVTAKLLQDFEDEVKVEGFDPPIVGHADGVITLWNGRKILLEIKSANDTVFTNRRKFKKPKEEHKAQSNIYAYLLGIDIIWVFYENKNNQDFEIFETQTNIKSAEKQLEKWKKVYKMYKDNILPDRPYKMDSQACSFCPLRSLCWNV